MADNTQTTEADVAIYLGSSIASSLLGGVADEFITGPVLGALGIGKSDDSAARYFQAVSKQLTALGESLDAQVRDLQDSLSQLEGISTQIRDFQTHEAVAQVLREYNTNASTIQSLFELFVDDVSVMRDVVASASTDPENNAITDLYTNVLNAGNAERVSEAMSRIRDLLIDPSDFDKGIMDCLHDMITGEIETYAATDENYRHTFKHATGRLPRDFQYYDCAEIAVNGHAIARAELPKIAKLFKRILATQLSGLIFLAKAWQESPHARTLGLRTGEVLETVQLMKGFYPAYRTTVKRAIAASLKQYGKFLTNDFLLRYETRFDRAAFGANRNGSVGFLNHDWIMMRVIEDYLAPEDRNISPTTDWKVGEPYDHILMVYQPWTDASELPAGADRYCPASVLFESVGGVPYPPNFPMVQLLDGSGFDHHEFDQIINGRLNPLPDDPPDELASVLNGLPSSEDELLGPQLLDMLQKSSTRKMALSFKCALDGQDAVWLQGHPAAGAVGLASRRSAGGGTSTAWRVFFTETGVSLNQQLGHIYIKCLGFNFGDRQYLNGKTNVNEIELTADPDPEVSGGTEWYIAPVGDNAVWLISQRSRRWLGGHADGSVSLTPPSEGQFLNPPSDSPGLHWKVYPYVVDADS